MFLMTAMRLRWPLEREELALAVEGFRLMLMPLGRNSRSTQWGSRIDLSTISIYVRSGSLGFAPD